MMDRAVQKQCLELLAVPPVPQKEYINALRNMQEACRRSLSASRYAYYGEILDGVILSLSRLASDPAEENSEQILSLCSEIFSQFAQDLRHEKEIKKDIVFLPYKVSMWDSLESIWRAAVEDNDHCNAYVIPIPYAELNPDRTVAEWHCEAGLFPEDVPVLDWQKVDLSAMHPDAIFIHNPYDNANIVTSVEERYYSKNLKPCTDCLVYVPYYATSGGMADGQSMCPAYLSADYIVIQSEKYRKFFDPSLPDEKFLPLGSPKFDKVIRLCMAPPEPPADWKEKMRGRTVYFYNTSLTGLLDNVPLFLQKMQYVFDIFRNRKDACLLWRPHPLLGATLKSMRPEYIPAFEKIRDDFLAEDFGIYDTTGDIEKTIAISDVYIGDGGTSVTSLFGVAGKPIFYFNNMIHHLPQPDDWVGQVNRAWNFLAKDWIIPYGNQLWHASDHDLHYHYFGDLSEFGGGGNYWAPLELDGRAYVCPSNAQDIVVAEEGKPLQRIPLTRRVEQSGAFSGAAYLYQEDEDYFFLLPLRYPAVIRYDFRHDRLDYIGCPNEIFVRQVMGEYWRGAVFFWADWLIFGSPVDNQAFAVNRRTLECRNMTLCSEKFGGSMAALFRKWGDDEYVFLPYAGRKVTRWNVRTGDVQEYEVPKQFQCHHPTRGYACDILPFSSGIFPDENTLLLTPYWGNMFLKIHLDTGDVEEWKTPFFATPEGKNEYFFGWTPGYFLVDYDRESWHPSEYHFYCAPERRRYHFDPKTEEFTPLEKDARIDEKEIRAHIPGFCEMSDYSAYGCQEDAFNSLADLVDGRITGNPFSRERQLAAYRKIAANNDGTAGEKVYQFIKERLSEKRGIL